MAGTLGVATLTYAPFAFFNLLNPLVAAAYGFRLRQVSHPQQGHRARDGRVLLLHRRRLHPAG
jgi:Na+/H+ antiporter NhaC